MNLTGENYEYVKENISGAGIGVESRCDYGGDWNSVYNAQSDEPLAYNPLYAEELRKTAAVFGLKSDPEELWRQGCSLAAAGIGRSIDPKIGAAAYLKAVSPLDLLNYFTYCVRHGIKPFYDLVELGFDPESLRLYPQITHQGYLHISRIEPCVADVRFSFSGEKHALFPFTREIFDPVSGRKVVKHCQADRTYYACCTCTFKRGGRSYSATAFFDELYIPDCEAWAMRPKELLSQKAFDRTVALAYDLNAQGRAADAIEIREENTASAEVAARQPQMTVLSPEQGDGVIEIKALFRPEIKDLDYAGIAAVIKAQSTSIGLEPLIDELKQPQLQLSDYEQTLLLALACKLKAELMQREGICEESSDLKLYAANL